jgi:ribosome-binding protein aMBF1 (putative translation factor)
MAKYSTGDLGGDSGGACELCGDEGRSLETATVAGAELEVCSECRKHGEGSKSDPDERKRERKRRKETARNVARLEDARAADTDWEEGTEYEDDPLPYLASGYGAALEAARQDAGLGTDELAAAIDADEDDIVAIEQGRAARAGVGGSLIEALEEHLDIELADR